LRNPLAGRPVNILVTTVSSISTSARAGQLTNCGPGIGPCHFTGQSAFSGPPPADAPPQSATCASSSAGPSGITATFADGSPENGVCTQGVHSP
jgi:hypothetical protein